MKVEITRSDFSLMENYKNQIDITKENGKWLIEVNTFEDIVKLAKDTGSKIIIDSDGEIEIYDYDRE